MHAENLVIGVTNTAPQVMGKAVRGGRHLLVQTAALGLTRQSDLAGFKLARSAEQLRPMEGYVTGQS